MGGSADPASAGPKKLRMYAHARTHDVPDPHARARYTDGYNLG